MAQGLLVNVEKLKLSSKTRLKKFRNGLSESESEAVKEIDNIDDVIQDLEYIDSCLGHYKEDDDECKECGEIEECKKEKADLEKLATSGSIDESLTDDWKDELG